MVGVVTVDHAGVAEFVPLWQRAPGATHRCRHRRPEGGCGLCEPLVGVGELVAEFFSRPDLYALVRVVRREEAWRYVDECREAAKRGVVVGFHGEEETR